MSADVVKDAPERWETAGGEERFTGRVFSVRTDRVRMPCGGGTELVERDIIVHVGSVCVLGLDDDDRVLLIRQYRHATGHLLWELPAGLRDVEGEPLHETAARELREEAGFRAETWQTLIDAFVSPGATNERTRIFLARGLSEVPAEEIDFKPVHEEAYLPVAWVPLEQAVAKVLAGDIHNAQAAMGILAAYAARAGGFAGLRPAGAPEGPEGPEG